MNISKSSITNFASFQKDFVIPVYQRNYSWDESDCEELIQDVMNIINNDAHHFFGTVVYSDDLRNNRYFVVDGQQRLATVLLLFCALRNVFPTSQKMFNTRYLFVDNGYAKNIKLQLNKIDDETFSRIINGVQLTERDVETDLYKNYKFFYEFFSNNKGYQPDDIEYALSRFDIALIEVTDENPQKIFDSVNFAGKQLTNLDRIKNYLLLPLSYEPQKDMYDKYWTPMERMVGEHINDFFIDWLIVRNKSDAYTSTKREHINERTAYDVVIRDFSDINTNNIEAIFREILHYAELYNVLLNVPKESEAWHLIYTLSAKQSMPLLLYTLSINEDIDYCSHLILSYNLRAMLTGGKPLSKQNAASCIQKIDTHMNNGLSYKDALNLSITSFWGNSAFISNENFRRSLCTNPIYNNKTRAYIKFLLFQIEHKETPATPLKYEAGTIEHIIPQKYSKWANVLLGKDEETINTAINEIGNLTLLELNTQASDKIFEDKIPYYKQSGFQITRNVCRDYPNFNLDSVKARCEQLADLIIEIYEYPNRIEVKTDEHNLAETFSRFIGSKPISYSCLYLGEDTVKTWVELLVSVLEDLFEYDEDIFNALVARNSSWGIFDKKYRKVAEIGSHQIFSGFSTMDILNYIKQSLEFYDTNCKTTFVADFKFKCKGEKNAD